MRFFERPLGRKSRKMLWRNPLQQLLPRLSLQDIPASHLIRKAYRFDQISMLEATCAVLMQLESSGLRP